MAKDYNEKGDYTTVGDTISLVPEDDADKLVENESGLKYTKREWLLLFSSSLLYFLGGVITSMIASFFPQEAKKRGVSSSLTGIIFGTFPLVFAILSPLIGKLILMLGIKTVLFSGILIEAVCMILYGIVGSMYSGTTFIVLSFLYRIVAAIGVASYENSSLLIILLVFKDKISTTFGLLEVSGSIGLMIGPLIGGGFHKIGGFIMPFVMAGVLNIVALVLMVFLLPNLEGLQDDKKDEDNSITVTRVAFIPGVVIMSTVVIVMAAGISFMEPTMAIHLKNITQPHPMSSATIGLVFLLLSGVYGLASPLVGHLDDSKVDGRYLILFGLIISGISFLFLGPTPLFRPVVKPTLWVLCISLVLFGLGFAFGLIPVISQMKEAMLDAGVPENEKSFTAITSIFNCVLNIGYVIGPVAGGYMVQYSSFSWASTIFAYLVIGETVLVFIYIIIQGRPSEK